MSAIDLFQNWKTQLTITTATTAVGTGSMQEVSIFDWGLLIALGGLVCSIFVTVFAWKKHKMEKERHQEWRRKNNRDSDNN